ncbi:hypothetical protein XAR_0545 [Xanthomonas citri pv. glycines str. 8ra]|nr:hypothetical protein XAR_0545 [Xanthomonas citri pv. glycines str. 8ra]
MRPRAEPLAEIGACGDAPRYPGLAVVLRRVLRHLDDHRVGRIARDRVRQPAINESDRLAGTRWPYEHHSFVKSTRSQVQRLDHVRRDARIPGAGGAARVRDVERLSPIAYAHPARRPDHLGYTESDLTRGRVLAHR